MWATDVVGRSYCTSSLLGGGGVRKERMGVRVGIQRGRYRDRKEQERLDRKNKQENKGGAGKEKENKKKDGYLETNITRG